MAYWLMKTEPEGFSIDDLARRQREPWDGVRNYQARNFMRDAMKPDDEVFVYHSACAEPGIAGIGKVIGDSYPDPTQFDAGSKYHDPASRPDEPRWWLVDIGFVRTLSRLISLNELKALPAMEDSPLVRRGNRLSILPITADQWRAVLALEKNASS